MMKTCSKCKVEKDVDCFSKDATHKDGLRTQCSLCRSSARRRAYTENAERERIRSQRWREKNPDYGRLRYALNRENERARTQRYREANPETTRATSRKYYKENAEALLSKQRRYREENSKRIRANERRRREENPDKVSRSQQRWRKENAPLLAAHAANRRARKAAATIGNPVAIKERVAAIYEEACVWCGATDNIHVDHIIPLSKGGAHSVENLQALCSSCNQKKGNKLPVELEAAV